MAMRTATSRCTGRGMKQMAMPTPKAPVMARRWSAQRRGSSSRSPKCRRSQCPWSRLGEGRSFFSMRRGIGLGTVPDWRRGGVGRVSVWRDHRLKFYRRASSHLERPDLSGIMRRRSFLGSVPRGRWMWEIVRAGGPLMWPIILCSITAAAIVLERMWTLQDRRVMPRELPQKVWQLIEANQVNDKVIAALEQNSPLGRLLAAGLANRH